MRARLLPRLGADSALALALCLGCGGGDVPSAAVSVDTLANGAVRTVSHAPMAPGSITLERLLDIQPPEDDSTELVNPRSLAVAADGSVLVSESGAGQIKVFGPDGTFQRSIGRRGQGPGEYEGAYLAVRGDTLLVQDPDLARMSRVLWRTGEYLNSVRTGCCYWAPFGVDAAGRAWVFSITQAPDTTFPSSQAFFRVAASGEELDTVFVYQRRDLPTPPYWELRRGSDLMMTMAVPLQPQVHYEVDPSGTLLTGWSGEYSIRETSDGRDTISLFGRDWSPLRVTAAAKQRLVDERINGMMSDPGFGRSGLDEATLRKAYDPAKIPDAEPAYAALRVDGLGRRWLQVSTEDSTAVQFDVFSREGRWLDTVRLPAENWPREGVWASWGRDRIAVRLEDEDGRHLLRVFAIRQR